MAADKHVFLKNGSDLFLREALERGDHVEAVRKIGFLARLIFERLAPPPSDPWIKSIKVICPTRRTLPFPSPTTRGEVEFQGASRASEWRPEETPPRAPR
jgi:hypothetical protein